MPDELTTATLEARRTEICAALEFSALNMKQALELMAELEDIDKKLANLVREQMDLRTKYYALTRNEPGDTDAAERRDLWNMGRGA